MELLGQLGINIKLLIAQIVNFGLLLFVLNKLLYKPLIKKIEEDEEKMLRVIKERKELEKEKEEFAQLKQKEIREARQDVQEMIKDAKKMADRIQEKTRKEIEKERERIIKQARESATNFQKDAYEEIQQKIKQRIIKNLKKHFLSLDKDLLNKWHSLFFYKLILNLELADLPKFLSYDKDIKRKNNNKRKAKQEEIDQFLTKKIGIILLEYALPINLKQERELIAKIIEKFGLKQKIKIKKRENKDLIIGFRLEIGGFLIESNLLSEIEEVIYKSLQGGERKK